MRSRRGGIRLEFNTSSCLIVLIDKTRQDRTGQDRTRQDKTGRSIDLLQTLLVPVGTA